MGTKKAIGILEVARKVLLSRFWDDVSCCDLIHLVSRSAGLSNVG